MSYQIVSLFDMYMDMGERIARKQDRPSLNIEDPLRALGYRSLGRDIRVRHWITDRWVMV